MQVGLTDIPQITGLPKASDYNKLATVVNTLRKINLGPNMSGSITSAGVSIDAISNIQSEYKSFPYGSNWAFGIEIINSAIRIWNPLVQRAGIMTNQWLSDSPGSGNIPDKVYLQVAWGNGSFEVKDNQGKFIVYYMYDTALGSESLHSTTDISDACTLPTGDGGGLLDPLRYYKIPLYTIVADKNSDGNFQDLRIWQDFIHGMYVPQIMG